MNNFQIKKKYGQNFIKDQQIIKKITDCFSINENDLVIEIGPGQGDLTKNIINKKCYYLGYEIDNDLFPFLNQLTNEKAKIIYGDFLQQNISKDISNIPYQKLFIVGNLPYYITTPIIKKIIKEKIFVDQMFLMVQKEVAERFCSKPKNKSYGSITVFLNSFFKTEIILELKSNAFIPKPKVDSSLIKFTRINPLISESDEDKYNKLLKDSFQFKRKNIKNNLHKYDLEIIEKILIKNNLSLQSRAEEIPISVFVELLKTLG